MPGQRRRRGPEGVAAAIHRRRIGGAQEPAVEISGLLGSVEGGERRRSRVAADGPTPRRFSVLSESETPTVWGRRVLPGRDGGDGRLNA